MLEPSDVEARIEELRRNFENLHQAHEAVLKAKRQIEHLTPWSRTAASTRAGRGYRGAARRPRRLSAYFASHKARSRRAPDPTGGRDRDARQALGAAARRDLRAPPPGGRSQGRHRRARRPAPRGHRARGRGPRDERDRRRPSTPLPGLRRAPGDPLARDDSSFHRRARRRRPCSRASSARSRSGCASRPTGRSTCGTQEAGRRDRGRDRLAARAPEQHPAESLAIRRSSPPRSHRRGRACPSRRADPGRRARGRVGGGDRALLHGFALSLSSPTPLHPVARYVDRTHLKVAWFTSGSGPPSGSPRRACPTALARAQAAAEARQRLLRLARGAPCEQFDYVCCESLDELRRLPSAITRRSDQVRGPAPREGRPPRAR